MRTGRMSGYEFGIVLTVFLGLAASGSAMAASEDAARAMAERFSGGGKEQPPAGARSAGKNSPRSKPDKAPGIDERHLMDEVDMLERARAEAEARREAIIKAQEEVVAPEAEALRRKELEAAEEARRLVEEQRRADEARRVAEERRRADEARRVAEEQRRADEARRVAEEQLRADEARRVAEEQRRADEARRVAEKQLRTDEARRVAEEQERAQQAREASLIAERNAEAERLEAELLKARQARELAAHRPKVEPEGPGGHIEANGGPATADATTLEPSQERGSQAAVDLSRSGNEQSPSVDRHATRVTVLVRIEPGNYGIRRHNKTADPLLCREWDCYVSSGADSAAQAMHRRRAFGIRRTLGSRAGACRGSLGCVFRGIELGSYPAVLQPVDMHVLRHDKREPAVFSRTSDCRFERGRLSCRDALHGPGYVMWVMPEELADRVGAQALQAAVDSGLPEGAQAFFSPQQ